MISSWLAFDSPRLPRCRRRPLHRPLELPEVVGVDRAYVLPPFQARCPPPMLPPAASCPPTTLRTTPDPT
eukprot:16429798-Heterocapsa_arctica.AAC.1